MKFITEMLKDIAITEHWFAAYIKVFNFIQCLWMGRKDDSLSGHKSIIKFSQKAIKLQSAAIIRQNWPKMRLKSLPTDPEIITYCFLFYPINAKR